MEALAPVLIQVERILMKIIEINVSEAEFSTKYSLNTGPSAGSARPSFSSNEKQESKT